MRRDANYYYARFTKVAFERGDGQADEALFRLDTRIYLDETQEERKEEDGVCVASVICINPGSARETELDKWTRLNKRGDRTLPTIRNRFVNAYRLVPEHEPPKGAFVSVLNLFYLVDQCLDDAIETIRQVGPKKKECSREELFHEIAWFAWGGDKTQFEKLNSFKSRFQDLKARHSFFYDNWRNEIREGIPSESDPAKHPLRGLPSEKIEGHLASIFRAKT